jgi:hypothetical protein
MSADATLPIERRFGDVWNTGRHVPVAGRGGIPGGSTILEKGTAW